MSLAQRIETLRHDEPRLRARDLAARLGVTEMEIVAAGGAVRLRPDWDHLLTTLPTVGRVMALTRNETVVHERKGVYAPAEGPGLVRTVLGPDIDLRLFLNRWHTAWSVTDGERRSIQVFDAHGDAVHKVFAGEATDADAWDRLLAELATTGPDPEPLPRPPAPTERPDADIDADGFRAAWRALTDTHGFFALLRKFGVSRAQAMRLGPPEHVDRLGTDALDVALREAAAAELPIMVFVGNPGCIQIHTGPVHHIVPVRGWLNVLDPDFNLHVRADRVAACWRVRKPTTDGPVTSLEVFDTDGELVLQLFGARKPGVPQAPAWSSLVEALS